MMKKIPTIYRRDPATNLRYVMNEPHPDTAWVFNGEGTPTYKWDGSAVAISAGMHKRREVKKGKPTPEGFIQEGDADPVTGKRVGWVYVDVDAPENKWHAEAYNNLLGAFGAEPEPGTYELVGPKVQGNPHQLHTHELVRHGDPVLPSGWEPGPGGTAGGWAISLDIPMGYNPYEPVEFEDVGRWLHAKKAEDPGFEGVVWHHPDGRMAKIKAKDFPMDKDHGT